MKKAVFQDCKSLVLDLYDDSAGASEDELEDVIGRYTTGDYHWRGMHPFYEQHGADDVCKVFWTPLRRALKRLQRRQDVFIAGLSEIDDTPWVMSMGHFAGLFDEPWLGIPATGKLAFLRYAEFHRITHGRISETALFIDIPNLISQAGVQVFPLQTGAEIIVPGPRTHDGMLLEFQDREDTAKTLALVNQMRADIANARSFDTATQELGNTWHDDMLWFGPSGIGSTYTIERYQKQHQRPFRQGLTDVDFKGHVARFAEANYAAWFGWPNLTARPTGGLMGLPASDRSVEMRVVDVYRREGDKLAENWIFIDLLHVLAQQGVDVLDRMRQTLPESRGTR